MQRPHFRRKRWNAMSNSDTVRQLLKLQESMNTAEVLKLFDNDATYQFANSQPAKGADQIRKSAASSYPDSVKTMSFAVQDMIELDGGAVVCELEITFNTKDGRKIVLPCTDLFRFNSRGLV